MVGCVLAPGLPGIAPALGVPHAASWLVTLPSLGVVLFGGVSGRFLTKVGAYRALCYGLVLYAVLGAGAVMLHGPIPVFADRILLGGATVIVMAAGTTLISEFFSGAARLAVIARQGVAIEIGGVIFLSIGGMLARIGWAGPFALYLVALLILAMVLAFVPNQVPSPVAEVSICSATQTGETTSIFGAAFLSMLCFFTAIIVLPFRLTTGLGQVAFSESEVGYVLSFVSVVAVVVAAVMPRIIRRVGASFTFVLAFSAYALAHLCFALAVDPAMLFAGTVLLGTGFGLSTPLVNHMTIERSDATARGRNLALLSVAIFLGQFASSFMELVPGGHSIPFYLAAGVSAITAIAWSIRSRPAPNIDRTSA